MWGRLNLDGGTLNLDGKTLTLDGGTRPPYNLSTDYTGTDCCVLDHARDVFVQFVSAQRAYEKMVQGVYRARI